MLREFIHIPLRWLTGYGVGISSPTPTPTLLCQPRAAVYGPTTHDETHHNLDWIDNSLTRLDTMNADQSNLSGNW